MKYVSKGKIVLVNKTQSAVAQKLECIKNIIAFQWGFYSL